VPVKSLVVNRSNVKYGSNQMSQSKFVPIFQTSKTISDSGLKEIYSIDTPRLLAIVFALSTVYGGSIIITNENSDIKIEESNNVEKV